GGAEQRVVAGAVEQVSDVAGAAEGRDALDVAEGDRLDRVDGGAAGGEREHVRGIRAEDEQRIAAAAAAVKGDAPGDHAPEGVVEGQAVGHRGGARDLHAGRAGQQLGRHEAAVAEQFDEGAEGKRVQAQRQIVGAVAGRGVVHQRAAQRRVRQLGHGGGAVCSVGGLLGGGGRGAGGVGRGGGGGGGPGVPGGGRGPVGCAAP